MPFNGWGGLHRLPSPLQWRYPPAPFGARFSGWGFRTPLRPGSVWHYPGTALQNREG